MSIAIQCQQTTFQGIKAVVFDKDGTLANSEVFLKDLGFYRAQQLERLFPGISTLLWKVYGLEEGVLRSDGLLAVGTRQENEISTAACVAQRGNSWASAVQLVKQCFQQADSGLGRKAERTPLCGGGDVRELLKTLAFAGLKLGVLSSDSTANVVDFVEYYGLSDYIHQSLGTDRGGIFKPNPELLHQVCQQLGVSAHETLMVGDSGMDMIMAKLAGAAGAVGVVWGWTKPVLPEKADIILQQCAQFRVVGEML